MQQRFGGAVLQSGGPARPGAPADSAGQSDPQATRPGASADDALVLFTAVHGLAALHSRRALDLLQQDPARLLDLILARAPESSR